LVKKVESHYEVDHDFIEMLAGFGLDELALPFETASKEMMGKYATNKYDPSEMNPFGILKAVKKNGIRAAAGFLIGFRDETWDSIVRTKDYCENSYYQYTIRVKNRDKFISKLNDLGINTGVQWPVSLHQQPAVKSNIVLPKAEKIQSEIVSIPCYPYLKEDELNYVIENINKII